MKVEPIGWAIAEYRFRRPAVGPFPTEADARAYLAQFMDRSQGWHVIPLNAPDPRVIAIVCRWRPFDPALDVGPICAECGTSTPEVVESHGHGCESAYAYGGRPVNAPEGP